MRRELSARSMQHGLSSRQTFERATWLHCKGELTQAAALYRNLLMSEKRNVHAMHGLAVCLHQNGQHEEARKMLLQAIKIRPGDAMLHGSLGAAYLGLGRADDAVASYARAAALEPANTFVLLGLAEALRGLGRLEDMVHAYRRALECEPHHLEALAGLGAGLLLLGRPHEALPVLERALARAPGVRAIANNRGVALTQLGRPVEAIEIFDALLASAPDDAQAHSNRANALYAIDRLEEACAGHERALQILPSFGAARLSLASTLMALMRYEEAGECLDRLIAMEPQQAQAHTYRAMLRLAHGDFENGWRQYEWRPGGTRRPLAAKPHAIPPGKRWTGRVDASSDLDGRSILLYCEQGHGDTIQFVRYVQTLKATGARVGLQVQPALVPLMRRVSGADEVFDEAAQSRTSWDLCCPLMSLPWAMRSTPTTIPTYVPPFAADASRAARWLQLLGDENKPRLRVGLAWSGSALNSHDRRRSIPLSALRPLRRADVQLIGLQPDLREVDRGSLEALGASMFFPGEKIADFEDTAALIDLCELIVCADTAVAHLAGAMNKPVWILLAYAADWRWMIGRADSPWYPSARLFRQPAPGAWASVIQDVSNALDGLDVARHQELG